MIKAILIDDEQNALDVLEMQLTQFCQDVEILEKCDSGKRGIEAIRLHHPELVFLDIEMPHQNGFDVLNETRDISYDVIFTTAYDQFAIKAFKYSAMDYLLKPIDIVELQQAVEKSKHRKGQEMPMEERIRVLLEQFKHMPDRPQARIILPVGDAMLVVDANDIIHCEGDSNYTRIHLSNQKVITTAKTLKDVEAKLEGLPFYRIHHSHLVNMNHIVKVYRGEGGYVVMGNGVQLSISRQRKDGFLENFRKI